MSVSADWNRRRPACIIGLVVVLVVLSVRAIYVISYGAPTPFFDQWDAEGDGLLRPWIEGTLRAQDWFAPHNEHRILWSRILSVAVYEGTGTWNNRNLAIVSSGIAAILAGVLAAMSWQSLRKITSRLLTIALLIALFCLPFSWENVLVGFQSQFYFMALFGVLGVLVASTANRPGAYATSVALAFGSVFSMASGLIGIVAAGATTAFSMVSRRGFSWASASLIILLAWIALIALRAIPEIPQHEALRAQGITQLFRASAVALSWPFSGYVWMAIPLWTPFAVATILGLAARPLRRVDCAAWGIAAMAFGQAIAMAYSRGEGMEEVPSRYTDILSLGIFANALLAYRISEDHLTQGLSRRGGQALVSLGVLGLLIAFGLRSDSDLQAMRGRAALTCQHQLMLQSFFADGDPSIFAAPPQALPYPDVGRLVQLARNPTLQALVVPGVNANDMKRCFRYSADAAERDYETSDAIVMPFGRVGVDGQALRLERGGIVDVVVGSAPGGQLSGVGLLVGTFGGTSDGSLELTACQSGQCSKGSADLGNTPDNAFARVRLESPLMLTDDQSLTLRWETKNASRPLGIWHYAAAKPMAQMVGPQVHGTRGVALELVVSP